MKQRKIEFRVWDKKDKIMYQPHAFIQDYQIRYDIILMQYSGLIDKNGKEIYEGDIVKITKLAANPNNDEEEEELVKELGIKDRDVQWDNMLGEVIFSAGAFGIYKPNPIFLQLGHFCKSQLEVVGNIYENSDLLKK